MPRLEARVEAGRRLVEEQQARPAEQLGRDARPACAARPTASRSGSRRARSSPSSSRTRCDRRLDVGPARVVRQPQPRGVAQRLAHGQLAVDDLVLGQVADVGEPGRDRLAADRDRPAGRVGDAGERLDQRRLAGAALADDRDELAGLDRERRAARICLSLTSHRDALGVQPQRAPLARRDEAGAVEDQPVRADPDLRARRRPGAAATSSPFDARAVARAEVAELDDPAVSARPRRGSARRSGRRARRRWRDRGRSPAVAGASGRSARRRPAACGAAAEPRPLAGDEAQRLAADHDRVAVGEPARLAAEALSVEPGSVRRRGRRAVAAVLARITAWRRGDRRLAMTTSLPAAPDRQAGAADRHPPTLVEDLGGRARSPQRPAAPAG